MPDDPPQPPAPPADSPSAPPPEMSTPSPPPAAPEASAPSAPEPTSAPSPSTVAIQAPSETVAPPAPITPPLASTPPPYPVAPAVVAGAASQYGTAPPVHHLTKAPRPLSTLPQQLRKLAYIVSIVVGGSAVLAGMWSIFLLPLLHATYSARNAIASAQKDRWRTILDKLSGIRALGIFPEPLSAEEAEERTAVLARIEREKADKAEKEEDKDKQLALQRSRSPDSPRSASISISHTEDIPPATKPPPIPMRADTADLSAALKDLAANLDATATTRTSLVSTLEGYTSGLHRELFLARGSGPSTPWGPVSGATTGRVGLGTLSANLANAGGKVTGQAAEASPLGIPPARSDEWDSVRREVRAIKGLLLNRRNFSVPARAQ